MVEQPVVLGIFTMFTRRPSVLLDRWTHLAYICSFPSVGLLPKTWRNPENAASIFRRMQRHCTFKEKTAIHHNNCNTSISLGKRSVFRQYRECMLGLCLTWMVEFHWVRNKAGSCVTNVLLTGLSQCHFLLADFWLSLGRLSYNGTNIPQSRERSTFCKYRLEFNLLLWIWLADTFKHDAHVHPQAKKHECTHITLIQGTILGASCHPPLSGIGRLEWGNLLHLWNQQDCRFWPSNTMIHLLENGLSAENWIWRLKKDFYKYPVEWLDIRFNQDKNNKLSNNRGLLHLCSQYSHVVGVMAPSPRLVCTMMEQRVLLQRPPFSYLEHNRECYLLSQAHA